MTGKGALIDPGVRCNIPMHGTRPPANRPIRQRQVVRFTPPQPMAFRGWKQPREARYAGSLRFHRPVFAERQNTVLHHRSHLFILFIYLFLALWISKKNGGLMPSLTFNFLVGRVHGASGIRVYMMLAKVYVLCGTGTYIQTTGTCVRKNRLLSQWRACIVIMSVMLKPRATLTAILKVVF